MSKNKKENREFIIGLAEKRFNKYNSNAQQMICDGYEEGFIDGFNEWAELHNNTVITEEVYNQAKKITDAYEEGQRKERHEKIKKLEDELAEYFANNTVGGLTITDFHLKETFPGKTLAIIVNAPSFHMTYPDEKASEDVRKIGQKYDERVKFPYWMYPK